MEHLFFWLSRPFWKTCHALAVWKNTLNRISYIFNVLLQKKNGTKVVTWAVPFKKYTFVSYVLQTSAISSLKVHISTWMAQIHVR